MNGLEAIELMKQGKMVSYKAISGRIALKIEDGDLYFRYLEVCPTYERLITKKWNKFPSLDLKADYEEYIEPKSLTGWHNIGEQKDFFWIDGDCVDDEKYHFEWQHRDHNRFETREKAEEINFKQTLFRKLQRFSDENGGNEIDWKSLIQEKYGITYNCKDKTLETALYFHHNDFGQVHFISREVTEQAIEVFHDELIKYFTGDFGGNK
ncbi:hypothetical protein GMC23_14315 [Turicibacter sanguinis]|nr:hypothetical protein [Turicibacter sanguinis]MTO28116.1 hypothetical protein [Turicibacter sanguinis]MTO91054.1 hypothetical protein [Turicibacter sanguinis]MTP71203.1 hypothetical protein [Turicibacter sanguinis]MTQ02784.1 hypothetical protein [Turicibacter sanguinis]